MLKESLQTAGLVTLLAAIVHLPAGAAQAVFVGTVGNGCSIVSEKEGVVQYQQLSSSQGGTLSSLLGGGSPAVLRYATPPTGQFKLQIQPPSIHTREGSTVLSKNAKVAFDGSRMFANNVSMLLPQGGASRQIRIDAEADFASPPDSGTYELRSVVTCSGG